MASITVVTLSANQRWDMHLARVGTTLLIHGSGSTDDHVRTYDVSTYSVSSDRVSDRSSELWCLGFAYMLHMYTLTIRTSVQHANAM